MANRVQGAAVEPALLNREQAAQFLGVSVSVIKDLSRDGWLPYVTLRRGSRRNLRRWSRAALERLIEQREEGGHLARLVAGAAASGRKPRRG